MEVNEYQRAAMRTSPEGHDRILNGCMGLIGEAGEVIDLLKKWRFQSGETPLPREKLIEELGDIAWYCAETFEGCGKSLADTYAKAKKDNWLDNQRQTFDIETSCALIAQQGVQPYFLMTRAGVGYDPSSIELREGLRRTMLIFLRVEDIASRFCGMELKEVLERNIAKLMKRYPNGFDPERSLHRTV